MTKLTPTLNLVFAFLLIIINFADAAANSFNVVSFGAKPDGKTDSTQAFLGAWRSACGSAAAATMVVPKGQFLLKMVTFSGPCRSRITFRVYGTVLAPSDISAFGNSDYWIRFLKVDRIALLGGTFDARAAAFWACRRSGRSCPPGARSITFNWANDVIISGVKSMNSQITHMVINSCNNVGIRDVRLVAPGDSPNTDGFHVQFSTSVSISASTVQTGDDCVAIGPGTRNLLMSKIACGPGHGVSIGSLAKDLNEEGVQNVTLSSSVFTGTQNGVRIKSWARPSNGFVKNVVFQNLIMRNVENPIIIDQNYCPHQTCPYQNSGLKISDVTFKNIQGTSATEEAVKLMCSRSNPCSKITLQDIKLSYRNRSSSSLCLNVAGTSNTCLTR